MERTIVISLDTEYFEFDYEDENVDNEDELYESAVDYFFRNVKIEMYQKGFPMEKTIEHRVIRDINGFYCEQVRFVPLEDWDTANDGWRTVKVSSIPIKIEE